MNENDNGNEVSEVKAPEAQPQDKGKGAFAAIIDKIKRPEELLSFAGRTGRGEYWAAYLLIFLPLMAIFGAAYGIGIFSDYIQTHMVCISIAAAAAVIGNAAFLPVMVRRANDLALPSWMAVAVFCASFVPLLKWPAQIAVIVLGCLNSKGDGDAAKTEKKLSPRMLCLYWLLAAAFAAMGSAQMGYGFDDDANKRMDAEINDYLGD